MQLEHRKIVLGVSGSIAAYKSCELLRLLKKQGADVKVAVTEAASKLVGKSTFEALSGHKVYDEIFTEEGALDHIRLSSDADLIVIAPASAHTIAKLACGMADNMLTAAVLAAPCRTVIAPAMNSRMYSNPATQHNLEVLKQRGFLIIAPDEGDLACGEQGAGRMRSPEEILAFVIALLNGKEGISFKGYTFLPSPREPLSLTQTKLLPKAQGAGVKVLITAGPTEEPIDPVRIITNKSSGKMGYALAAAAKAQGAEVTLISGPTALDCPEGVRRINVKSCDDMLTAVKEDAKNAQIVIGCAAVSDYKLAYVYDHKLTKEEQGDSLTLTLIKNEDIISYVGHLQENRPFTVGFAAETHNGEEHAKEKLERKNLDLIVLNDVSTTDTGINSDFNEVEIFDKEGRVKAFNRAPKSVIAQDLISLIFEIYKKSRA